MKKMLMIGIYGLVILGASFGGTWFLRQKDMEAQQAAQNETDALPNDIGDLADPVNVTSPLPDEQPKPDKGLPIAVRPDEMSVEEIVRYGLGLKKRESAIHEREEALRRTETQHRLVLADIDGEQKEIEGLLAQARDQRTAAEQLLEQARQEKVASDQLMKEMEAQEQTRKVEQEKAAAKGAPAAGDLVVDKEANIKELAKWIGGIKDPSAAADAIRTMANDGKTELGVEVL